MNDDLDRWHAANDRYLKTELQALRRRLSALSGNADTPTPRPSPTPPVRPRATGMRQWLGWRGETGRAEPVAPAVDAVAGPEPAEDSAAPADAKYVPALVALSHRLGLSDFERQTLLLCAAMEFDTGFGALCAQAHRGLAAPTFGLALAAFEDPAWDVMSPERPLRYWRLLEIHQSVGQPLIASALKADERIVNYIKGLNYLDDRLSPMVKRAADPADEPVALAPSQSQVAAGMIAQIERTHEGVTPPPVFQLLGDAAGSKLALARQVAIQLGLSLYRLPVEAIPAATGDNETFARLWQRETALLPVALYVDASELDGEGAQPHALQRFLERSGGLVVLDTRVPLRGLDRPSVPIDVAKPSPVEQRDLWRTALGAKGADQAALLSGQFNLDPSAITAIAAAAKASAGDDAAKRDAALWRGALDHARPAMDQLAQAITPKATWDDIELPERERTQLRQIAAQVRNRSKVYDEWGFRDRLSRGLGISVLFAGDSGTGKTMAAEALARDLGLLLYRIDLSGVVSKFIGETEKNLRRLFDAADDGGAILFFDEADALFGKRSEVKDSHDRYANIEINYLLQRIESYRGLAILTTNMKSSLDQAFVRRLRFIVNFPFPGPAERLAIWRKSFPAALDTAGVDFERLGRLNITGGSIHNIALGAAFAAAAGDGKLTMPILLEAARSEYAKLEKPINEADFRWLQRVGGAA